MSDYPKDELARHRNPPPSTRTSIPSQYEYEMRESREYQRQIQEVERASLSERKEAAADFLEAMRDHPDTVGERVGWLIDGNYGKGAYDAARRVLAMSKRANKAAMLTHMIAALEWRCPARAATAAWKKLSPEEKRRLDTVVRSAIAGADEE